MKQRRTSAPATERGARIIQLATQLMAAGQARGWSDAMEQARKQVSDGRR